MTNTVWKLQKFTNIIEGVIVTDTMSFLHYAIALTLILFLVNLDSIFRSGWLIQTYCIKDTNDYVIKMFFLWDSTCIMLP